MKGVNFYILFYGLITKSVMYYYNLRSLFRNANYIEISPFVFVCKNH